jgi:Ala-tRNA(Pro) deacylase
MIAKTVEGYLQTHGVPYSVVHHPRTMTARETADSARLPAETVAKAVVLSDRHGYLMAVIPADRHLEMRELCRSLRRLLEVAPEQTLAPMFKDCEQGAIPPLGPAYGIETVVDERLTGQEEVCFIAGDHEDVVCVSGEQFERLLANARYGQFCH